MSHPTVQTPTITVGTRLTDYATLDLIVEGLASGGMGLVVWGYDASSKQMEALKLLKPERVAAAADHGAGQLRAVERQFENEALTWCHLWYHPCVIRAFALTRLPAVGNLTALELAYAPQGSLRDVLRHGRQQRTHPPLRAALAWAIHIAAALAHIHQPDPDHDRPAPLVHCDLKPENVLLNEQGWAQLTDLGLTRAYAALAMEPDDLPAELAGIAAAPDLTPHQAEVASMRAVLHAAGVLTPAVPPAEALFATRTLRIPAGPLLPAAPNASAAPAPVTAPSSPTAAIGSRGPVAGSPPYMAPEQWLGLDAAVPATDLYAFGVLLFELFAGTESPHLFPFDPTPYFTPLLSGHALATGYDPLLLAWHAAHSAPDGPRHRLTDPDVTEAALRSGPFAELAARGDRAARAAGLSALQQLDALIMACLAHDPGARPSAEHLQRQLVAFATGPCGLAPNAISIPRPAPVTPQNEDIFWANLGVTYSRLNRQQEAIAAKRRAIQHNPTDPSNWMNLAASLDHLGLQQLQQAAAASTGGRSAEVAALDAAAHKYFAEALAAYEQAEAHLTPEIVSADPGLTAQIANNKGNTLSNLGRYAEAVTALQRALAVQPDKHDARFNLALVYAQWSQVPDAAPSTCLERLHASQREVQIVLTAAPDFTQARDLTQRIARALADPAHRFHG